MKEEVTRNHYPEKESNENVPQAQLLNTEQQSRKRETATTMEQER